MSIENAFLQSIIWEAMLSMIMAAQVHAKALCPEAENYIHAFP